MYADDTQIYTSFTSQNVCQTKIKIENCLPEINNWMYQNYLKINQNKTELIVFHPTTKVSIALVDSINIKFKSEMLGECNFIKVLGSFQTICLWCLLFPKNVKFVLIILEI